MWYLAPENCAFAFFDESISLEVKRKMIEALKKKSNENIPPKKFYISSVKQLENLASKEIDFFINNHSMNFFKRFGLNIEFLDQDCEIWKGNRSYQESREKVKMIRVVNDCSERAVKVTEEFINILTNDLDQKKYLIQVVEEMRRKFKKVTKTVLIENFQT